MKSKEIEIKFPKDFYINKNGLIVSEITLEELNKIIDYIYEQRINLDLANYVNVVLHNRKVIDNLQQRIDKAVELLKEAGCYDEKAHIFCDDVWEELPELLDILRGDE